MLDRIFRNKEGRIVILQTPNWLAYSWFAARIAMRLVESGQAREVLGCISVIFVVVWAVYEIYSGENYFRRLLGVVVMAFTVLDFMR